MRRLGWAGTHRKSGFACTECRWLYALSAADAELPLESVAQAFWAHDCSAPRYRIETNAQNLETVSTCNSFRDRERPAHGRMRSRAQRVQLVAASGR